jgi:DHA1 family inner membrane transport protein
MEVASHAQSLAASMNHSAFNLSNAIGAWTGGLAISAGYGWQSTGLVGAMLACGGLLVMVLSIAVSATRTDSVRGQQTAESAT